MVTRDKDTMSHIKTSTKQVPFPMPTPAQSRVYGCARGHGHVPSVAMLQG